MCERDLPDTRPAYRVQVIWTRTKRPWLVDLLICGQCYQPGGQTYRIDEHHTVMGLVGNAEATDPTPCAGCGRIVVRGRSDRLKSITCSKKCTVRVSKGKGIDAARETVSCASCGEMVVSGRADQRFCSGACRQSAYRQRKSAG